MALDALKSLLTTVALVLGLALLATMGQIRGYVKLVNLPARTLVRWHRWLGVGLSVLVLLIMVLCLYVVFGLGIRVGPPRVQAHVVLGAGAAIVLLAKVLAANRFRRYLRHSLKAGLLALALLAGTFVFSALWYFLGLF